MNALAGRLYRTQPHRYIVTGETGTLEPATHRGVASKLLEAGQSSRWLSRRTLNAMTTRSPAASRPSRLIAHITAKARENSHDPIIR